MFGKLKEKLKSWVKGSKEKIEETAEKTKTKQETDISEKEIEKAEKLIEKAKEEPSKPFPSEFNVAERKFEPDVLKIKQEVEHLEKEVTKAKQKQKETKKYEKALPEEESTSSEEPTSTKDPVEILSEKPSEEIIEVVEQSPKEVKADLKEIKQEAILEEDTGEEDLGERKSFFTKLKSSFSYKILEEEFDEIFEDLEMLLLENNVALEVVEDIKTKLSEKLVGKEIKQKDLEKEIKNELKNTLNEILIEPDNPLEIIKSSKKPFVILFFGINGTGKTTSIAKIAYFLKKSNHSVVLAAADTFRAASIEQIAEHAKKLEIPLIKQDYGTDPSAVGFDAIKYAKNHNIDVVLIDTAGRMHTKTNLIAEMEKICRVTDPDLKIFVAESIAGNDATEQARTFNEAIEIDGSILSKADIDEKGGTIISISHATNKPIFYLGVGQGMEDLQLFNKQKFIESLGL